jgi:hypothetical protein
MWIGRNVQQKMQENAKFFSHSIKLAEKHKWVEAKQLNPTNIWQIIKKSS